MRSGVSFLNGLLIFFFFFSRLFLKIQSHSVHQIWKSNTQLLGLCCCVYLACSLSLYLSVFNCGSSRSGCVGGGSGGDSCRSQFDPAVWLALVSGSSRLAARPPASPCPIPLIPCRSQSRWAESVAAHQVELAERALATPHKAQSWLWQSLWKRLTSWRLTSVAVTRHDLFFVFFKKGMHCFWVLQYLADWSDD